MFSIIHENVSRYSIAEVSVYNQRERGQIVYCPLHCPLTSLNLNEQPWDWWANKTCIQMRTILQLHDNIPSTLHIWKYHWNYVDPSLQMHSTAFTYTDDDNLAYNRIESFNLFFKKQCFVLHSCSRAASNFERKIALRKWWPILWDNPLNFTRNQTLKQLLANFQ